MAEATRATVRIIGEADADEREIAQLTAQLRRALLELDVDEVQAVSEAAPDGSKGVAAVVGWLSVTFTGGLLTAVAERVAGWAMSLGRTVEISVDGDTLKLGRVTHDEQRELIREWLARHPAPSSDGPAAPQRGYL